MVGDLDGGSSITWYIFTVCSGVVSWSSKLQPVVALSTPKAKYIPISKGSKEMIWLQGLLQELGRK